MKNSKIDLKKPVVEEIAASLKDAKGAVLVDARGLTVAQDTKLRKNLREAGVSYKVYKNTMIKLAAQGTDYEQLNPLLEGPTALAVSSTDETAPARIIFNFAKDAKTDKLELKGGIVGGEFYDQNGIQVIATIPSKDELIGRLLGSMKSPISNFARVLNQIAEKGGAGNCEAAPAAEEAPAEAPVAEA